MENTKNFTCELTSHKKIHEVNNSMCHNYYYVQYGRIINQHRTKCRKFKFIVWFDIFDVCEHFDKDSVTKKEIAEFASELASSFLESRVDLIKSFDDYKSFYDWCNETIKNYNKIL